MGLKPKGIALSIALSAISAAQASAATVSYSGTLATDDQVQMYSYTLNQNATVVFSTDSYGGGVTDGSTVAAGGFVPVLTLFDSSGVVIGNNGGSGMCSGSMLTDPTTGLCDDAYLQQSLAAGTYTLALTEFFNEPNGPNLSDGFSEQGQGNFTGPNCNASGAFYQTDVAPCVQRTGNFSLSIASTTATPEPSTLWLAAPLLFIGALLRRNRTLPLNPKSSKESI